MNRYFPIWAAIVGFCFGVGTNFLNVRGITKYENAAQFDLSTLVACALVAIIGLFHALTCIQASRESWQTVPERFDIAFAVSYVLGVTVITPFYSWSVFAVLLPPAIYLFAFAGTCSKDERSIVDIIMRRSSARLVGGFS